MLAIGAKIISAITCMAMPLIIGPQLSCLCCSKRVCMRPPTRPAPLCSVPVAVAGLPAMCGFTKF